jgi:hypothetical protein
MNVQDPFRFNACPSDYIAHLRAQVTQAAPSRPF